MTSETLAANTTAKAAASTGAGAIIRVIQSGVSKKVTMIAAVVEALSAASTREFCKALGLWCPITMSGVAATITNTTTETALATITLPGGAMGPNGVLRVTSMWSHTGSANSKTLRQRLGGSGVSGTQVMSVAVTTTVGALLERIIFNRNAQNSQITGASGNSASYGTFATAVITAAIDTSVDQQIALTGQMAALGETLTLEGYMVQVKYGA